MNAKRSLANRMVVILCATLSARAHAAPQAVPQPRYATSEIAPDAELESFWTADFDVDGREDIIAGTWGRSRGRELLIYLQRSDGSYPPVADRRVEIKSDIVAFALADVREDAGPELLLLTPTACYSYSTLKSGYAGNAEKLFDCTLVCFAPETKRVLRLETVRDLDGDGSPEVLIPEAGAYSIYSRADPTAGFVERLRIPLSRRARTPAAKDRRTELVLDLGRSRGSWIIRREAPPFAEEWSAGAADPDQYLLRAESWIPSPVLVDLDSDGARDLFYFDRDESRIVLHRGRGGGLGLQSDWSGALANADGLSLADIDGNRRSDLLVTESEKDDETNVRIYLQRENGSFREEPDQVLKVSGYRTRSRVVDLDGDGSMELVLTSYSLSTDDLLRGGTIVRTTVIFRREASGAFRSRPDSKLEERIGAADAKSLFEELSFEADVLGTGGRQVLSLDKSGALIARRFSESLRLDSDPCFRFVPRRAILDIASRDLNSDRRTDLILRHLHSLTVLVSR